VIKIWEPQAEETAWSLWLQSVMVVDCGAGVESGQDSLKRSVFSRQWNIAEESASG